MQRIRKMISSLITLQMLYAPCVSFATPEVRDEHAQPFKAQQRMNHVVEISGLSGTRFFGIAISVAGVDRPREPLWFNVILVDDTGHVVDLSNVNEAGLASYLGAVRLNGRHEYFWGEFHLSQFASNYELVENKIRQLLPGRHRVPNALIQHVLGLLPIAANLGSVVGYDPIEHLKLLETWLEEFRLKAQRPGEINVKFWKEQAEYYQKRVREQKEWIRNAPVRAFWERMRLLRALAARLSLVAAAAGAGYAAGTYCIYKPFIEPGLETPDTPPPYDCAARRSECMSRYQQGDYDSETRAWGMRACNEAYEACQRKVADIEDEAEDALEALEQMVCPY